MDTQVGIPDQNQIASKGSRVFFSIFFGAILASIALTFYTFEIERDFHTYAEEEEIPEPLDIYRGFFEKVTQALPG